MASGEGGVERRPQSIEDDPAKDAAPDGKREVEVKKPRPTLTSTAKSVGASVRDIVKKNKAARLLQKMFRRKRKKKKKKGNKSSKLEEIPEEEAAEEEEEEEEGEGRAEEKEAKEEEEDVEQTPAEDDTASVEKVPSVDRGEVDDGRLAPVDEAAKANNGAHGLFTVIAESDKVKSKAEVGEIENDHIKSVSELAKLMQSRDEETRKKNEESKVKHSAAAQFFEEKTTGGTATASAKGKSPEVRKVPLHF